VRLVYAPPEMRGELRRRGRQLDVAAAHSGDFALLRAYAGPDNAPNEVTTRRTSRTSPAQFLKVSAEGMKAGDFVGVLGYPGQTQRYLPVVEVERFIDQVFPGRIDLYGEWIDDPRRGSARRIRRSRIKVASTKKSLANRFKNAQGMIAGLRAMDLVGRRRAEEAKLEEWAGRPDNAAFKDVLGGDPGAVAGPARQVRRRVFTGEPGDGERDAGGRGRPGAARAGGEEAGPRADDRVHGSRREEAEGPRRAAAAGL
jgi:hypothetical protein